MDVGTTKSHHDQASQPTFNDWPNDAGVSSRSTEEWIHAKLNFQFETFHEEKTPIDLKVTGKIPAYAA